MSVRVVCFEMDGAGDVSRLAAALDELAPARIRKLAVIAKTEGHHGPNDFSRDLLRLALAQLLESRGLAARSLTLLSIGCEGVGTPLGFALAEIEGGGEPGGPPRLAIGFAASEKVPVAAIGAEPLVDVAAATVRAAIADAGLTPGQVGVAFVKVPILSARHPQATPEKISLHYGRAIAALGAGVALGDIPRERITAAAIAADHSLYARHAEVFAGAELDRVEAIVLGNRPGAGGDLAVHSTHTRDMLDQTSIRKMLAGAGVKFDEWGEIADGERIAAVFVKTGVPEDGMLRGARTTVYSSSLAPELHMRAAQSGVLGSLLGHTRFYISADPVHQAPPGGGVAAAIVRAG